ncbi:MAG: FG-GAP-like repeat-containing protein [Planctomycetota bacterium]
MRFQNMKIPTLLALLSLTACGGGGGGGGDGGANRAPVPSATLSTLQASALSAPADGIAEILLTATVRDAVGDALAGRTVRFEATAAGARLVPPVATANGGGLATTRLTSSEVGLVTVRAVVVDAGIETRLAATVAINFVGLLAPVVVGPARFEDGNENGVADSGDAVVVTFSEPIALVGAAASDFALPVFGDSFGSGATVVAGPGSEEVTIALGAGARLRSRGRFDAAFTTSNEPSGVDLLVGQAVVSAATGTAASASAAVDIAPAPVRINGGFSGGSRAAYGDINGDATPDVLILDQGTLRAIVGSPQGLEAAGAFSGQPGRDLKVSDLNRVGAAEAVVAQADGVRIWNNSATGGAPPAFSEAQLLATGDTRAVAVADLNADGYPDILAGTATGVVVALHQRNLGNTFAIDQSLALAAGVRDLTAADLDADGDLDLLVSLDSGVLQVLDNVLGQLLAGAAAALPAPGDLAAGDVDGDGRMDFAVSGADASLVRVGSQGLTVESLGIAADVVELVDLDGDAFADLVAATAGGLQYLQNDRAGAFLRYAASTVIGAQDLLHLDVEADGDMDIVAVGAAATGVFVGSLAGTFGDTVLRPGRELGSEDAGAQQLGDVNADGFVDRVVAMASGVQVWFGDGVGGFTAGSPFGAAPPTALALGDMDGDGDLDCVLARLGNNELYRNDGLGGFAFASGFGPASDTRSLGLTDVDLDGDLDVFVGNNGDNQMYVNDGSGSFTQDASVFDNLLPVARGNETLAVLVRDLDRDGDEDVILINGGDLFAPQNAFVLERNSLGYSLLSTLFANLLATGATMGDVDGDGREDLAIAQLSNDGSATIKWFRGLANGVATQPQNVATNGQYFSRSVAIADINADGRSDFVVGDVSVSNQPIAVIEQQPNGAFVVAQEVPTTSLERLAVGDFDRDGDLDIVTVETTGPSRVLANR